MDSTSPTNLPTTDDLPSSFYRTHIEHARLLNLEAFENVNRPQKKRSKRELLSPFGGMTAVLSFVKETDNSVPVAVRGGAFIAFSLCSTVDNFCRSTGRTRALARLQYTHEAMDLILHEESERGEPYTYMEVVDRFKYHIRVQSNGKDPLLLCFLSSDIVKDIVAATVEDGISLHQMPYDVLQTVLRGVWIDIFERCYNVTSMLPFGSKRTIDASSGKATRVASRYVPARDVVTAFVTGSDIREIRLNPTLRKWVERYSLAVSPLVIDTARESACILEALEDQDESKTLVGAASTAE
jgi:hypothetical protein